MSIQSEELRLQLFDYISLLLKKDTKESRKNTFLDVFHDVVFTLNFRFDFY